MNKLFSYLYTLECSECRTNFDPDKPQTYCPVCQAPLLARYKFSIARDHLKPDDFRKRACGIWRWHSFLPVKRISNIVSLGEGDTPLLHLDNLGIQLGLTNLYVKEESLNPTGTFKARGLSTAISKAKELGIKKVIIPSAGNAGAALAAYATRASLDSIIVMPRNSPKANIVESQIVGAKVILIDGLINNAADKVREITKEDGWFDVSTFREPYRVEGKKIMGYELAEFFDWSLPDVIIYPTGGGTGMIGMWKAFEELQELGWLPEKQRPRMVAIQATGCAPIVEAFESSNLVSKFWENAETIAKGLCVPKSFADKLILRILRESNGIAISVRDEEISEAQKRLANTEGIFAAPEGAATLAGLINLLDTGWINRNDRIVIFNTGTGLKYLS